MAIASVDRHARQNMSAASRVVTGLFTIFRNR
jgi:hypothetical protein